MVEEEDPAYGLTVLDIGMDERVLDYHDCLLRVRDVALLTGSHWLNDNLMSFYFQYMQREKFVHLKDDVAFVDGSVGFLVANMPASDVGVVLQPLKLAEASLILFQVSERGRRGKESFSFVSSLFITYKGYNYLQMTFLPLSPSPHAALYIPPPHPPPSTRHLTRALAGEQ